MKTNRGRGPYRPAEIKPRRGERADETHIRVLNNFFMHFGETPWRYRWLAKMLGKWDSPYSEGGSPSDQIHASELKWNQTHREFYDTLDLTVVECGFTLDQVEKAIDRWFGSKAADHEEQYRLLWEVLRPIYVAMRKKGYSIQDLRG